MVLCGRSPVFVCYLEPCATVSEESRQKAPTVFARLEPPEPRQKSKWETKSLQAALQAVAEFF